jgi:hypothetical protein
MESSKKRKVLVECDEDEVAALETFRTDRVQKIMEKIMDRAQNIASDISTLAEDYNDYLKGNIDIYDEEDNDTESDVYIWISRIEEHLKQLKSIVSENPDAFPKRS